MSTASTKRRNAIIAAAAAAALLMGGSTYALWSASSTMNGGTITAGNLDVKAGTVNAFDVSADRSDINADGIKIGSATLDGLAGHDITSLSTWRIVPGDTVAIVLDYAVTLQGDNLVAGLTLDASTVLGAPLATGGFTGDAATKALTYEIGSFGADGAVLTAKAPLPASGTVKLGYVQAPNDSTQSSGSSDAGVPFVGGAAHVDDQTGKVYVVVFVTFNSATTDQAQINTQAVAALGSAVKLTVSQVRCGGNYPACV